MGISATLLTLPGFTYDQTTIILVLLSAILLGLTFCLGLPRLPLPPGPWVNHLPIFGFLPFFGSRPAHVVLTELAEKYGPIFRVQLGTRMMVVISDPQLLRDAFKRGDLVDRPHTPLNDGLMDGYGISSAEGHFWKNQRQFALSNLRDLGMLRSNKCNKERFQNNVSYAIQLLLSEVESFQGKPFDMEILLSFTVANIFCSTVVSKSFDLYDPLLMGELEGVQDSFQIIESISIANFIPIFCYLPRFRQVLNTVLGRREATRNFFRKIIQEHRETLDREHPRDLIDAFLLQMDKDDDEGNKSYFTEIQLLSMMGDLFSAGTETTKTSIRWLLLAMARKPHIQAKLQQELDNVIGRSRCPSLTDLSYLPYTEACLQEILRLSSVVPTGNPHCPRHDIVMDGYLIPKGVLVTGLLWKFHHDPLLWKTPFDFDPENFLQEDGKVFKPDYLMPFSVGRRVCIGEDIARNEIFVISACLLQRFTFLPPEGDHSLPAFDETRSGFLQSPVSYKLRAIPRY